MEKTNSNICGYNNINLALTFKRKNSTYLPYLSYQIKKALHFLSAFMHDFIITLIGL